MSYQNFLPNVSIIKTTVTPYNVVFSFRFLNMMSTFLWQHKISNYFTNSGRGTFSDDTFLRFVHLFIFYKLYHIRFAQDPNIIAFSYYIKDCTIPVWLQNIINCVPTLPLNSLETIELFGLPFTLDSGLSLNPARATDLFNIAFTTGFGSSTLPVPILIRNCLDSFNSKNYYTGPLTNFDVTGKSYFILQHIISDSGFTNVTGFSQFNRSLPAFVTFGNSRNFTTNNVPNSNVTTTWTISSESSTVATPQQLLVLFMLRPTLVGFNWTTWVSYLNVTQQTFSVDMSPTDPTWAQFIFVICGTFPNPSLADPDDMVNEKYDHKGDFSHYSSLPKIKIRKVRRTKDSKVSFVDVSLDPQGLSKKLSSEELKSARIQLGQSLLSLEKSSNILQVESSALCHLVNQAWRQATESIDPKIGSTGKDK